MQLFIRDPSGQTTAFTASTPLELQSQVYHTLNLSASSSSKVRLSHRSRTLSQAASSSSSFEDLSIVPYSTIDVSFRLRGGGPKKRCAHVFVKAPSSTTPSSSGVATPTVADAVATVPAATASGTSEEKKEVKEGDAAVEAVEEKKVDDVQASGPVSLVPTVSEPILERCGSAALRMVGECPKCSKNFCGQHRLPEDHACPALQVFRKAAFDENMKRLNKEATFNSKISAF